MKSYKAIIVDDERPVLQLMKHVISRHGRYVIEGTYVNPEEALDLVSDIQPDVAFLDIEMPKLSGLQLAHKLQELSPSTRIVFSTAYKKYAVEAFDVFALDYILKPVTAAAIQRVTDRLDKLQPQKPRASAMSHSRVGSIRCFGAFEVKNKEGELIRWPTRKTEELFAFLLCQPDQEIDKWKLADALWPELDEERAVNNMYNTVYRLKKALKEHGSGMDVHKTQDGYSLDIGDATSDLAQFHLSKTGTEETGPNKEEICKAYQGKLLDTKDYSWKLPFAESYSRQHEAAVRAIVIQRLAAGDWEQAESRLHDYLAMEPLNDRMNNLLMEVYEKAGQPDKARRHFARFAAHYRSEFGEEPGWEPDRA